MAKEAPRPAPSAEPAAPTDQSPGANAAVGRSHTLAQTPLRRFFEAAVTYGASDLLVRGGQSPRVRLKGKLQPLKADPVDPDQMHAWVYESLSPKLLAQLEAEGAVDLGVSISPRHRFRVNIFQTRGVLALAARLLGLEQLDFEKLHLPPVLGQIAAGEHGLVLVGGVTGAGKTTTIAAMLQHINRTRACHILTLEEPIEFVYIEDKAMIHQREVGVDVPTFAMGLRALVRENPDVVLIGEMRDRETFEAALRAAETGHLVFGTIHAPSTTHMFTRIYDLFPADHQPMIRAMLAGQMRAFICQKLLATTREQPSRVPALEILMQSPPTRKHILDGRENDLDAVIREHRDAGMQTMLDSLVALVEKDYIAPRTAEAAAPSAEELRMRLRGIVS
jgi:twitching motility protein PilT